MSENAYKVIRVSRREAAPLFRIVGPGSSDDDMSYGDCKLAEAVCELLNRAFFCGLIGSESDEWAT